MPADILTEARAAWPAVEWQLDPEDAERAESVHNGSPLSVEPIDPSWHPLATDTLRFLASAVIGGAEPVDVETLGRTVAEAVVGLRRRLEVSDAG